MLHYLAFNDKSSLLDFCLQPELLTLVRLYAAKHGKQPSVSVCEM
jgi:hypothetical protein